MITGVYPYHKNKNDEIENPDLSRIWLVFLKTM